MVDKFFVGLGVLVFNLFICYAFPLVLLTLIYKPVGHWGSVYLQTTVYWLGITFINIVTYFGGNRALANAIGRGSLPPASLHRINAIIIYALIALFLVSVYLHK